MTTTQSRKFDSAEAQTLHALLLDGFTAGEQSGDVQAPTGAFAAFDMGREEVLAISLPILAEAYGDRPASVAVKALEGYWILEEDNDGFVSATNYGDDVLAFNEAWEELERQYVAWADAESDGLDDPYGF